MTPHAPLGLSGSATSIIDGDWFVEGKPVPQGSMRAFNNRVVHNKPKELMAWRNHIALVVGRTIKEPTDKPVEVVIAFQLLRPKSASRLYPSVKPDLDKLIRSVLDALTGIAYIDDSQVISIKASKRYDTVQGVAIGVYEWTQ
jgi:crossover junction endodeoxyribonuclease RusA